ncbi:Flp family type IVb pilin [Thiohalomonas denitrificans]|uniref:Flp family type IVb pilin n=1 Tax=Thiohalomonas denitrificans TaxID=415747 RepID=UPI0026F0BE47|nr:hypothetical protein [Thiohalomonas denitrificans]
MKGIFEKVKGFIDDESGLTMVEYAVAGSLVTLGAVAAFTALGTTIAASIDYMASHMATAG